MATGILFGDDTCPAESSELGAEYLLMWRFQCLATGTVSEIKWKPRVAGHGKLAIYADNVGAPAALLRSSSELDMTADVLNTAPISALSVTKDTWYWLAVMQEGTSAGYYTHGPGYGTYKYQTRAYSLGFPDPAGGGYGDLTYDACISACGIKILSPSSISQPVSYGSPKISLILKPSGIAQSVAIGTPVVITTSLVIYPPGIAQVVGIGTPILRYPQVISPQGIAQPATIGQPWVGIFGFIKPQSTIQQMSIGSPTIIKYVWHVILDGQYSIETPEVNRAYIIGRDQYGNPVYGTVVNADEIALVGERLDFQQELAIPTNSQAASMASAILSKIRITKDKGVILVPPNCGQELFDVVQISDLGANQSAVKFRIAGIKFEYDVREARYQHRLILKSP